MTPEEPAVFVARIESGATRATTPCGGGSMVWRIWGEGRPLLLLVRETPLHLGHLRCLTALAEMGAVIMPPMPAFYNRPRDLDDVVNATVARVLDRLNLPQTLVPEWQGTHPRPRNA